MKSILAQIESRKKVLDDWLTGQENSLDLPLYSSVDIRDAGFKAAVVDTNLFPAGFNNLCQLALPDASKALHSAIERRVPNCRRILLLTEEHTRNKFYIENVKTLVQIIEGAGFEVITATFLHDHPDVCHETGYVELETASGDLFRMHCLANILKKFEAGLDYFDLVILNNDLSTGIPAVLADAKLPIYPPMVLGWHSRLKSTHFNYAKPLFDEFGSLLDADPWHFSCLSDAVSDVSITNEKDRLKLAEAAERLLDRIRQKYTEHGVPEKPFIFLKANSGTYGMGVMPVESPDQILSLNRKARNKLTKSKSATEISRFILQEGVPTITSVDQQVSEAVVYQIANTFVGGFYRVNSLKSSRENLNAQGMSFRRMCTVPYTESGCKLSQGNVADSGCGIEPDKNLTLYSYLARISGIAAQKEIQAVAKGVSVGS